MPFRFVSRAATPLALSAFFAAAAGAQGIEPYHAQTIEPHHAQTIEPYHAETVRPVGEAGIDPVEHPVALDRRYAGTWRLNIPGVAYQTETDRGDVVERKLHTGAGATFGVLTIAPDGRYVWRKSSGLARGRLQQVTPRRDAAAGNSYWRLVHGGEVFYLTLDARSGRLSVYTAGANSFVANGDRAR